MLNPLNSILKSIVNKIKGWVMVEAHVAPTPFCETIRKINNLLLEPNLKFNPDAISEFYLLSFNDFSKTIKSYHTEFLTNKLAQYPVIDKRSCFFKQYSGDKVLHMPTEHIKILLVNFNIYLNHARFLYTEVEINNNRDRDYVVALKYSTHVCLDTMAIVDCITVNKN